MGQLLDFFENRVAKVKRELDLPVLIEILDKPLIFNLAEKNGFGLEIE